MAILAVMLAVMLAEMLAVLHRVTIKLTPIVLTATKAHSCAEASRALDVNFDKSVDAAGPVTNLFVIV